ncbi:MAG: sulfatase [Myxococcota bacterium]|nr:sulfatase [Myxococcota bacterium]
MCLWVACSSWLGCGGAGEESSGEVGSAPTPPSALDLGAGGAERVRLLSELDQARFELPARDKQASDQAGTFSLKGGWSAEASKGKIPLWSRACPVSMKQKRFSEQPKGMTLIAGSRELKFIAGTSRSPRGSRSWEVVDGRLYVAASTRPDQWENSLVLRSETAADQQSRYDLTASGLTPKDFVQVQVTHGRLTRESLLVPAPGRVTFSVLVPQAARLVFGYGMAPAPSLEIDSQAEFSVQVGAETVWSEKASLENGWSEASIDLSAWSGQQVNLTLATDPDGEASHDYAVFADPAVVGDAASAGPRRIIVVGVDTLRPDHLGVHGYGRDTSPKLDQLAAQSVVFERARAPAPRTRPSFRTVTTGRWPLPAINAPTFGEVLRQAGFTTAGVVANVHLTRRMGFTDGFDWWEYENAATAETQVDRALGWLESHRNEDSFLFLHLMDPHIFYNAPEPYLDRFTEGIEAEKLPSKFNRWQIVSMERKGTLSQDQKDFIEARYDGEIAYVDDQLGRFFQQVDAMPGRTLVVLLSDHGEEFWEHDGFEHNHTLYDEVVRVVLWIRPPGGWSDGPHRVGHNVSLADVAPTLYDAAGIETGAWPEMDGISLRPFVDAAQSEKLKALESRLGERVLPLGHLMYDKERWAAVRGDRKYVLETASGEEELYDLHGDAGEQASLQDELSDDPERWRADLAEATSWPVGAGWRVQLDGGKRAFQLEFEEPVIEAGVVDPEAATTRRANLEWGQELRRTRDQVAVVTVSQDRRTVSVTPGKKGRGLVYVLGPTTDSGATCSTKVGKAQVSMGEQTYPGVKLTIQAGTLIVPKDSEVDQLARRSEVEQATAKGTDADASDNLEALRALGYVE